MDDHTSSAIVGQLVDLHNRSIYPAKIVIKNGQIAEIIKLESAPKRFLLPGFVDAHIHIESSMLIPSEFARLAVLHGTVATVSDPHEIANVLGVKGVEFMIENGKSVPLKFHFGAPSCVPPTAFETSGAEINSDDIKLLLSNPEILYLAEMMNYPGVLYKQDEVMKKLQYAKDAGKPIDGHAPGLTGDDAIAYIDAGISTDHECFTYDEAKYKLDHGMKILIREGSAAKNYDALATLFNYRPDQLMFCSDDKHPDDLINGHINLLVKKAVSEGYDIFDVLRAACIHPIEHYGLEVGQLRVGDPADFIVVNDLQSFEVVNTYIDGDLVADDGQCLFESVNTVPINHFDTDTKRESQFALSTSKTKANVIKVIDNEIVTESMVSTVVIENGKVQSDLNNDILKIAVVNRYENKEPSLALIHGFGLTKGAIASCVGHDTHNIIAVGCDDKSITRAVNLIISNKGGISAVSDDRELVLPLPYAGIMTDKDGVSVGLEYAAIDRFTKSELGCKLTAPFMTLSFMALLVIPDLKLSDKGLFDGSKFEFTDLLING